MEIVLGFFFLLVSICFLLTIVQLLVQNYYSLLPIQLPKRKKNENDPFISVHVPSCNEPPYLLMNTIRALAKQKYQECEVIIFDNNTPYPKTWKPVARYCATLGKKIHFLHIDKLKGHKAAALNTMRDRTHPKAEYIATVDSDYETSPAFLSTALQFFSDPNIGFVQFPQAYLNTTNRNAGIILEYEYFFSTFMNGANRSRAVNATGTLTIFRKEILKKVGNYNIKSITEDADIGYRLITKGYYGVYVPLIVGRGLIPYDIADYKEQKLRWAKGNSVILKNFFKKELLDNRLTIAQKISLFSQLTAWLSFTLPAIVFILLYGLLVLFAPYRLVTHWIAHLVLLLSTLTLSCYLLLTFSAYLFRYFGIHPLSQIIRAYTIHLSMHWIYSTAWFRTWLRHDQTFSRTNKFISPYLPSILVQTKAELLLTLLSAGNGILLWQRGQVSLAGVLFIIALLFSLVYYFIWEISNTKTMSAHLMLNQIQLSFKR